MRSDGDARKSLQRFFGQVLPAPWDVRKSVERGQEPERPYALIEQLPASVVTGSKNLQDVTLAFTANLYLPAPSDGSRDAAEDAAEALRETVFRAIKWGLDVHHPRPDRIELYSYEPRPAVHRFNVRAATAGTYRLGFPQSSDPDDTVWTDTVAFDAALADVAESIDVGLPDQTLVVARGRGIFDIAYVGDLAGQDPDLVVVDDDHLTGPEPTAVVMLHGAQSPWRSPSDYMTVESFGQTTIRDPDTPGLLQVAVDLRCTFARGLGVAFDQMLLQSVTARS